MNKIIAYIKLARLSNIPTVWTNCLLGFCYAQITDISAGIIVSIGLSLFYIAGMFLNDYCDTEIDKQERPQRPIPSGVLNRNVVLFLVSIFFAVALLCCYFVHKHNEYFYFPFLLMAAIIIYDYWHKSNPISPLFMASCRFLVYIIAASSFIIIPFSFYILAMCAASYIIGLTYAAKQENLMKITSTWPLVFLSLPFVYFLLQQKESFSFIFFAIALLWTLYCIIVLHKKNRIGQAIGYMIAGISLIDAALIAILTTNVLLPGLAVGAFCLTLVAQKYIPGT